MRAALLLVGFFFLTTRASARSDNADNVHSHTLRNGEKDGGADSYVQVAARQALLDYSVKEGLSVLAAKLDNFSVPDVTTTINLPVVGDVLIKLSKLDVVSFNANVDDARLAIMDGFYHLLVHKVETHLSFSWYWEKMGLHGNGDGELKLSGGAIDFVFKVLTSDESHMPELQVISADAIFDNIDLNIHASTVDWLYQAVLTLFRGPISKAVQGGIASALSTDVPAAVNKVLLTLPTKVEIEGLPISFFFDYSIYTLRYVLLTGFAEVDSLSSTKVHQQSSGDLQDSQLSSGKMSSTVQHSTATRKLRGFQQGSSLAAAMLGPREAATQLHEAERCPLQPSPLPFVPDAIAQEERMVSLYFHENMANCLAWGLYRSGLMQYSLVDGSIDKLHLTTDLLSQLIPDLPKTYPHMLLRLDIEALAQPQIGFGNGLVSLLASYSTAIYVDNATLGTPHIATLRTALNITADISWDTTVVRSVSAVHEVEPGAAMEVPTKMWDLTVMWFVQNYGGLYPLQQVINMFVKSPVISLASLVNAETVTVDHWFALSADVQVHGSPF